MRNPLIERLCVMFGMPDTDDPKAWREEIQRLTKNYSATELDKAADLVIGSHRGHRFPSVSEMLAACSDAREMCSPPQPQGDRYPEWSKAARAKADELMLTDLGRRAADEGWALAFHDFCRVKRRLPVNNEIGQCRATSKQFDEAYATCVRGEGGLFNDALKRLGDSFLDRRKHYADMAYGVVS